MNVFLFQSMKPFWTISQMSTLDGSPKLERQVRSSVNMNHWNDTILFAGAKVLSASLTEDSWDEGIRVFPPQQEHGHEGQ